MARDSKPTRGGGLRRPPPGPLRDPSSSKSEEPTARRGDCSSSSGRRGWQARLNNNTNDPPDEAPSLPNRRGSVGGPNGRRVGQPRPNKRARDPSDVSPLAPCSYNDGGRGGSGTMSGDANARKAKNRDSSPRSSTYTSRRPYDDYCSENSTGGHSGRGGVKISGTCNARNARTNARGSPPPSSNKPSTRHPRDDRSVGRRTPPSTNPSSKHAATRHSYNDHSLGKSSNSNGNSGVRSARTSAKDRESQNRGRASPRQSSTTAATRDPYADPRRYPKTEIAVNCEEEHYEEYQGHNSGRFSKSNGNKVKRSARTSCEEDREPHSRGRGASREFYDDHCSQKSTNTKYPRRYPNMENDEDNCEEEWDENNQGHNSGRFPNGHGGKRNVRDSDEDRKSHRGRGLSYQSSRSAATCQPYVDHCSDKSTNHPQSYPSAGNRGGNNFPLHEMEEEQYEEYQEQLYQQLCSPQSQSPQCPTQQQFSSTHRQFNLAPLYDDVEMAPINQKEGEWGNEEDKRQQKKNTKDARSNTRPLSRGAESTKANPTKNYDEVLAYLESSDTDNGNRDLRLTKRHEQFYNYDDGNDEEDDESDDEERPLRKSDSSNRLQINRRPPKSVLSWSEILLNRSLVLAFSFVCLIFIRNRTPWWKEHQKRVMMQKHRHHHNIDNTDDDDLKTKIDPMSVYNTNDDDSTHTRDHDPLNKYAKYTQDHGMSDLDPNNKYNQATAGKRISNRPGVKSLHHGFMDEDYADRPKAEHSGSNAAVLAGVRNSGNQIDEEKAAFLESVMRSPTKKKMMGSSSSNAADDGGGEKEYVGLEESDTGQGISPPPLPPSTTDEVPMQATLGVPTQASTGSDVGASGGMSSPHYEHLNSQQTSPLDPLASSDRAPMQGVVGNDVGDITGEPSPSFQHFSPDSAIANSQYNAPEGAKKVESVSSHEQETLGDDSNYEAISSGPGSSANPQDTGVMMSWVDDIVDSQIPDNQNGENMLPPEEGNILEQSLSHAPKTSDGKVSSVKEMPLDGNESSVAANTQTAASQNEQKMAPPFKENVSQFSPVRPIVNQALNAGEVKSVYQDSYYRWNHPLRPVAPGDDGKDVPVFWRIPRSASGTVESIMSFCYRSVLASSMGTLAGHDQDQTLDVVTLGTGAQYVNVDMSRPDGIRRAKRLSLGSSGLVDIISTPFLFETAEVFSGIPESGKCFTLLRHPVNRAISLYHHYQVDESGNPNTAQYRGMSIDEFADQVAENNWMVRFLANKRSGSLNWHDLEVAKEVFGRKCLVGLVEKAEESLRRYERFFRWDKKVSNSDSKEQCLTQYFANGDKRKEHPTYEGTAAWEALRKKNEYDCLLYEFAEKLYTQQSTVYEKLG